ncbi:MAG: Wzz/FepE/Etk N-terminal domain-containing protein [Bacteroidales bacterium]|nr:Wzz/FepE/Etk N-terminal domain-containing protein [Bacteroidales bacterium]MDD3859249.1 Wzz/FepE/Etk N-terminal domain-containing protein [Bacteroidales bacterium]
MQESVQENIFSSTNLIRVISQNKIILLAICCIAFVFSIVLCFYIPPKYKSTVILFPTSSGSISQALITESQQKKEILNFGEEEDVEQLMQVLLSSEIRNRIIEKYDLFSHYRIKPDSKYAFTQLYKKYESNVKISRTEYMSIKIEVLDESPDTAALIANDIAALVDSLYAKIQKERATKAFYIVEKEFISQKNKIKAIEDSLSVLSKLGVIDVKSQSEMYSEQHAIAIATGNERAKFEIEKKLDILATYGSSQTILLEQMFEEVKQLAVIEAKYREAKIDLEQDLPNTYIVSPAEVADKKHSPIYWLTISITVFSTLLFSIIILIFIEKYIKKKVRLVSNQT